MRGTCRTGLAGRSIPVGTSKVIVAPAPESWWVTALTPELCPGPHSWGCHVAGWRRLRGQGRAGLGVGTWTGEAGGGDRAGPAPALGGEQGHAARVPCTCVPPGEQVAPYRQAHSRLKTAARLRPTPSSEGGQPPRLLNVGLEGLGLVQTWDGPEPLQDASLGGLPEQHPHPISVSGTASREPTHQGNRAVLGLGTAGARNRDAETEGLASRGLPGCSRHPEPTSQGKRREGSKARRRHRCSRIEFESLPTDSVWPPGFSFPTRLLGSGWPMPTLGLGSSSPSQQRAGGLGAGLGALHFVPRFPPGSGGSVIRIGFRPESCSARDSLGSRHPETVHLK